MIHLVESSLTVDEDAAGFTMEGYKQQFITIGPGKGIATYFKMIASNLVRMSRQISFKSQS